MPKHKFTEGERRNMQEYWKNASEEPRKNLIKLVRHVNMLNPFPDKTSWEYIYFDRQLTDEMVDFLLKMKLRKPYYIADLAKMSGMDVDYCAKLCAQMAQIGILEYTSDDKGVDMMLLSVFAPGCMESAGLDPKQTEKFPEMAVAFPNYVLDLQKKIATVVPMGQALMRTIPVEEAIKNEPTKVKYEEISYWLDKAGDSISVADCQCRRFRRYNGEGTDRLEGEWCIEIGKYADYAVREGKARKITRQEAEAILKDAEERGFVHQLSNIDGPDFSVFICNCSYDSCMALKTAWYTATPNLSASNYVAEVNTDNCVACGGCMEICPQNAVKLGQKIKSKHPITIKDSDLPKDHLWIPSKRWQPNFLTSRVDVIPETGTAPCKTNCPAHIAVQGYLKLAAKGEYDKALELIKKENPFPAVCGRVCARFCEQACTRGDVDAPLAIDEVKKFIADRELSKENRFIPKKKYDRGEKIAIIGSGPAGLSCAYYLAIFGHDVTVFEKNSQPGGMMKYGIPSFRLEKDIVDAEIEVIKELGVNIVCNTEIGKDKTLDDLRKEGYKGFYVAIGAQGGRKLGIPNEDAEGVIPGVTFLKNVADDKTVKTEGNVVVVGGGNVAVDVARTALRAGATSVTMLCLESRDIMPASADEVEEAEHEGIKINCSWGPKEIVVENGKVKAIVFKKCVSVFDENHRFSPKYDEDELLTLDADYVLTSIGQSIEWGDLLKNSVAVTNRNGTVQADTFTYQTLQKDIFVGGDVYTGPRFAIDAIAAGKQGAESLHRFVHEGHDLLLGRDRREYKSIDKEDLLIGEYDTAKRQTPPTDESKKLTYSDERLPLTEEQVKVETARCLSCGAAHVDPNICIGCGLCTVQCKFDAIHLHKVREAWSVTYEELVPAVVKEVGRRVKDTTKRKISERK